MARMTTMQEIIIEPPAADEVVDPMTWFDTPGPFELEIGCGKGGFLLSRARTNPHLRLLGIEWANKFFKYAADRMARWGLTNVRLMRTDAKYFVMRNLPPACVDVLHLYHPDPWPKKRHHKRRLVQPEFVGAAIRVIAPGGRWLVQSDHAEYFEQIERLLGARPELAAIEWTQAEADPEPDWRGTNFEIKYAREGRTIHRAAFRRL
jgi:tRNA (guanine-N7-)-methyltransferase